MNRYSIASDHSLLTIALQLSQQNIILLLQKHIWFVDSPVPTAACLLLLD